MLGNPWVMRRTRETPHPTDNPIMTITHAASPRAQVRVRKYRQSMYLVVSESNTAHRPIQYRLLTMRLANACLVFHPSTRASISDRRHRALGPLTSLLPHRHRVDPSFLRYHRTAPNHHHRALQVTNPRTHYLQHPTTLRPLRSDR